MGKRILVADDSQTIQQAFAFVFGLEDAELVSARSFDQALSAARQQRPDIVIADGVLGDKSGYDLCAALKNEGALADVPIYILASKQVPFDEARAAQAGADGHFIKPFESQKLIDGINAAIASGASGKTPVASMGAVAMAVPAAQDSTSKVDVAEPGFEDEDSYGEFSIESTATSAPPETTPAPAPRAPAPAPTPPPVVAARPALVPPAPAAPAPAAPLRPPAPAAVAPPMPPRPSLIPGVRPGAMPPRPPMLPPHVMGQRTPPVVATRAPTASRPTVPETPAAPEDSAPVMRTMMGMSSAPAVALRPTAPAPLAPAPAPPARAPITTPMMPPPSDVRPAIAERVRSAVDDKVAEISARGPEYAAIAKLSREVIEQIVWEVVPELAEVIIRENVDRLAKK